LENDAAAAEITAASAAPQYIYVGPNIGTERLNRFALFRGGKPERFKDLFTACPAVEKLFVDVDKLAVVTEKIGKTGTAYNTWYAQVQAYLKKG
jgi:hypothetical protein